MSSRPVLVCIVALITIGTIGVSYQSIGTKNGPTQGLTPGKRRQVSPVSPLSVHLVTIACICSGSGTRARSLPRRDY